MIAPVVPSFRDPGIGSRKKRVLLVDSARSTRDLRSETMRRLGAEVDCAADISEARCWWRPDLYRLVLLNVPASKAQTDKFCDDIRRFMPQQQIMFFVGKPDYLGVIPSDAKSVSAKGDDVRSGPLPDENSTPDNVGSIPQRWGILEACRRIAAVRSKMDARSRAIRDLPGPKRDTGTSRQHGNDADSLLSIQQLLEET